MLETITETLTTANAMAALIDEQNSKNQDTIQKIDDINAVSDQFKNLIGRFLLDPNVVLTDDKNHDDIHEVILDESTDEFIDELKEEISDDNSDDHKEEV